MAKFLPVAVIGIIYLALLFYVYPYIKTSLQAREKICRDETVKLHQTRDTDQNLATVQKTLLTENAPYADYDQEISNTTQAYSKAEDAQKLIITNAQAEGLKIGPSRLAADDIPVNTLEGGDINAREFIISVEGTHQQIGEWMAKSEAMIRTCRPEDAQWYPLATTNVGAKITFYLLDDAMNVGAKKKGAK